MLTVSSATATTGGAAPTHSKSNQRKNPTGTPLSAVNSVSECPLGPIAPPLSAMGILLLTGLSVVTAQTTAVDNSGSGNVSTASRIPEDSKPPMDFEIIMLLSLSAVVVPAVLWLLCCYCAKTPRIEPQRPDIKPGAVAPKESPFAARRRNSPQH